MSNDPLDRVPAIPDPPNVIDIHRDPRYPAALNYLLQELTGGFGIPRMAIVGLAIGVLRAIDEAKPPS